MMENRWIFDFNKGSLAKNIEATPIAHKKLNKKIHSPELSMDASLAKAIYRILLVELRTKTCPFL